MEYFIFSNLNFFLSLLGIFPFNWNFFPFSNWNIFLFLIGIFHIFKKIPYSNWNVFFFPIGIYSSYSKYTFHSFYCFISSNWCYFVMMIQKIHYLLVVMEWVLFIMVTSCFSISFENSLDRFIYTNATCISISVLFSEPQNTGGALAPLAPRFLYYWWVIQRPTFKL